MGLREDLFQAFPVSFERSPFSALPPSQGAWVNTELEGELLLANPQSATQLDDSFPEVVASIRKRRVPKKLNDLRHEVKSWGRAPFLPVGYRVRVNAKPQGNVLLEKAEIETPLAKVVADCPQFVRIG